MGLLKASGISTLTMFVSVVLTGIGVFDEVMGCQTVVVEREENERVERCPTLLKRP